MFRNKLPLLIYILIGLAIFGFLFELFSNTGTLIKNLLITVGFGVVVFGAIYYFLLKPRSSNNDIKKYKKAVKQSKNKYKDKPDNKKLVRSTTKQPPLIKKRTTKTSTAHLRVIDGNKHKRKNRASF